MALNERKILVETLQNIYNHCDITVYNYILAFKIVSFFKIIYYWMMDKETI